MEIFDGYRALFRPLSQPVVAFGNFDGVHRGHRTLIDAAIARARDTGGDSVVYTFDPHPASVLSATPPPLLTTRERRLELIADAGIEVCVVEPFDRDLANMTHVEFVDEVLVKVLGAAHVIVGYDFTFGKDRGGNVDVLRSAGEANGFSTEILPALECAGSIVSSSRVRALVAEGDVASARLLLGRPFDVDGTVVRGAGRGREIGIPTANIAIAGTFLPAPGIYAVTVTDLEAPSDPVRIGAASLGTNPTFVADGALTLEVHILDFEGDLYGRRLRIGFVDRLRGEERYDTVDALLEQIHRDITETRRVMSEWADSDSAEE